MREKEASTTLIYIRHGHTDFPSDRIYCDSREDPPLSEKGRLQASNLPDLLSGVELSAIYSSPCARTLATARPLAEDRNLSVTSEERLRERHFGEWEGLFFHEIEQHYPEDYRRWKRDNAGFAPVGGETVYALRDRLIVALSELLLRHKGETIGIVSHVGPIRVAVSEALELPIAFYRRLTIDNASITSVSYGKSQNNLHFLNRR